MNSPEGQHIDNFFFATNKSVSWVFSYAAEVLVTATFQGYKKSQNIATVSSTKATMSETTAAHAEVEIEHKRNLNYITTAAHLQATAIANATSEAQCIESRIAKLSILKILHLVFNNNRRPRTRHRNKRMSHCNYVMNQPKRNWISAQFPQDAMRSVMCRFLSSLPSILTTPAKETNKQTNNRLRWQEQLPQWEAIRRLLHSRQNMV